MRKLNSAALKHTSGLCQTADKIWHDCHSGTPVHAVAEVTHLSAAHNAGLGLLALTCVEALCWRIHARHLALMQGRHLVGLTVLTQPLQGVLGHLSLDVGRFGGEALHRSKALRACRQPSIHAAEGARMVAHIVSDDSSHEPACKKLCANDASGDGMGLAAVNGRRTVREPAVSRTADKEE